MSGLFILRHPVYGPIKAIKNVCMYVIKCILSHPIPSHLPSHPISHPILSYLILSYLILSFLILSYLILLCNRTVQPNQIIVAKGRKYADMNYYTINGSDIGMMQPLSEPVLAYCQLDSKGHISMNIDLQIESLKKSRLQISSSKWRQYYLCVNVVKSGIAHNITLQWYLIWRKCYSSPGVHS